MQFATDDLGLAHHLVVGLACVLAIALVGWLSVVFARRRGLVRRVAGASVDFVPRALTVTRISMRLQVAVVQIAHNRAVVVADNGRALEKLGEIELGSSDPGRNP